MGRKLLYTFLMHCINICAIFAEKSAVAAKKGGTFGFIAAIYLGRECIWTAICDW